MRVPIRREKATPCHQSVKVSVNTLVIRDARAPSSRIELSHSARRRAADSGLSSRPTNGPRAKSSDGSPLPGGHARLRKPYAARRMRFPAREFRSHYDAPDSSYGVTVSHGYRHLPVHGRRGQNNVGGAASRREAGATRAPRHAVASRNRVV